MAKLASISTPTRPAGRPSNSFQSSTLLRALFAVSLTCLVLAMLSTRGITPSGLLLFLTFSVFTTATSPSPPTSNHDALSDPACPFVINTWSGPFTAATDAAFDLLANPANSSSTTSALDAVQIGCATCEANQCDGTVGFGGSPDENCETTLDAMIMDGTTMDVGSVAGLRRVKDAIAVARMVLDRTEHTMLSGDLATQFATSMGFVEEGLSTADSSRKCEEWKAAGCLPNFRVGEGSEGCGPYSTTKKDVREKRGGERDFTSHDTISMIVIDGQGKMAAGTSTNGASHKIPGRVGDGPITGSGSYVDGDVGGCGATGDGDIMMRFLPCYQAVENMRNGMTPTEAAEDAVRRMVKKFPEVLSGVVVVDNKGRHGGAGSGWTFTYSYRGAGMNETKVVSLEPVNKKDV